MRKGCYPIWQGTRIVMEGGLDNIAFCHPEVCVGEERWLIFLVTLSGGYVPPRKSNARRSPENTKGSENPLKEPRLLALLTGASSRAGTRLPTVTRVQIDPPPCRGAMVIVRRVPVLLRRRRPACKGAAVDYRSGLLTPGWHLPSSRRSNP
ncbi:hypothetical protein ACJJTC_011857 [Scirpophaga incertulas]